MKEKTLFKIAIVCSLVGISVLLFVSDKIIIERINIGDIDDSSAGEDVRVIGTVERVSDTEKVVFLEVGQQKIETASIVLFKEKEINLKKGDVIELIGEVEEYNGKNSIIANAVKVR